MSRQPGRSVQLLKSTDLGRHSLLYLKEIGHGWFGKVFLGEVNAGLSSTQVVVKELKASASVQDQMQFLEEAQPYRALQHTNLLQCLAQCAEVTPYLLVMEFCPLGDLKGYLRSCHAAEALAPDPLTLQRMACEVSCGLLHLHRNNYVHSDLALRNCLLTADLTVKIGDYGLSHCKYKDDYFVTADQLWVPLRWVAPELIDEVHGNLLIVDQTKTSNIWSLGVTIWELFELGGQPYCHYSDRQVLTYAIKEQQLKLPKPQLPLSLSDRWYEVMQFCWLQPEQRPTAEEVHLLLSYLCAKGASEAEEDFERRWNSMKPGGGGGSGSGHLGVELSSFPLLEHFSGDGDDVLTVMETSHGLNFEYKWDQGKAEHLPTSAVSPRGAARYHELYYAASSGGGGGAGNPLSLGVSPSCYECKVQGCPGLHTPGVLPVLSAHSPSLNSEYYIRIEEAASEGSGTDLDYTMCSYSPEFGHSSRWQSTEGRYAPSHSPTASLTMEPLLGHSAHGDSHWEPPEYYSYGGQGDKEAPYYDEASPKNHAENYLLKESSALEWPVLTVQKSIFADPLGVSPSVTYSYREARSDSVTLEMEEEEEEEEEEENTCNSPRNGGAQNEESPSSSKQWTSNTSANNNSGHLLPPCEPPANDSWCYRHMITFQGLMAEPLSSVPWDEPTLGIKDLRAALLGGERVASPRTSSLSPDADLPAEEKSPAENAGTEASLGDTAAPLTESGEESHQAIALPLGETDSVTLAASVPEPADCVEADDATWPVELMAERAGAGEDPVLVEEVVAECSPQVPLESNTERGKSTSSEQDRTPDKTVSSASFPDLDEASDEDTAELTSGVFSDFQAEGTERQDILPTFKSLQKQVGTPDSLESLDIPSTTSSCEAFSPTAYIPSSQPKALDSGYDTENYESPEFVLKEPHEPREPEAFAQLGKAQEDREDQAKELSRSDSFSADLQGLDEKNPYRDSAYFSDYDAEGGAREDGEGDSDGSEGPEGPPASQADAEGLGRASGPDGSVGESVPACVGPSCPLGDSTGCPSAATEEQDMREGTSVSSSQELLANGVAAEELDTSTSRCEGDGTVAVPQTPGPPTRSFLLSPVAASVEEPPATSGGAVGAGNEGLEAAAREAEQRGAAQGLGCPEEPQSSPGLLLDLSVVPSRHSAVPTDLEEEEEDTEDSDESDEELRCYNIQDQSEESEEESPTVPIVVAESNSTRNLRSLLKMPSLLVETFCDDLERKKKAVSFTEDVTVYLFDQESPTKELAEQPFPGATDPPLASPVQKGSNGSPSPTGRTETLVGSSAGSASGESKGGGFDWKDDFALMPVKSSVMASLAPVAPEPALPRLPSTLVPAQKQVLPIQFSRFTVSPAPGSRFSITHVTSPEVKSVGGSSENGDRE
ncbi:serine/threonine-protein kinase LMTK1 [Varanus komodoensis]|uniref:serine/threonine-protein kinase LMTK1 n=1 Tax=Varanus komodoensis TaxID=61221 RepID=UPI001CF76E34|nr:serine/threonine-protein kinase LMTK1 [Varanus komodoensis]